MYKRTLVLLSLFVACSEYEGTKDLDGDGAAVGEDCNDANPAVSEGATEVCGNGVDEDCDGADAVCAADNDLDGYTADADCDDADPAVNPAGVEDCNTDADDDCDGVRTECTGPDVEYHDVTHTSLDSYAAHVFGDTLLYGNPILTSTDGYMVGFDLEDAWAETLEGAGYVTNSDSVFLNSPTDAPAYGTIISTFDETICVASEYWDNGSYYDAGRAFCYTESDVRNAVTLGTLDSADADFTVEGGDAGQFTTVRGIQDFNGDGNDDVWFGSTAMQYVVYGTGAAFSGTYTPADADVTFDTCATPWQWCGWAHATTDGVLAVSGDQSGVKYEMELYELPFTSSRPRPTTTVEVRRNESAGMTSLPNEDLFVVGTPNHSKITLLDETGLEFGTIEDADPDAGFGFDASVYFDLDGHEKLVVMAPAMMNNGVRSGGAYVFDVTANGIPDSSTDAVYVLQAPKELVQCGLKAEGGVITDTGGDYEVVAMACMGDGGLAFILDTFASPAPTPTASDIQSVAPGRFAIRRSYTDLVQSYDTWVHQLAQTEAVHAFPGGPVVGWRLHRIYPDSALHRAGLRAGDVVNAVNGEPVNSPAAVNAAYEALSGTTQVQLTVRRGTTDLAFVYEFVQD